MPSKTKSQLMAENAALRARVAVLEDTAADPPSGKGGKPPERDVVERKRIEDTLKASEFRDRRLFETAKDGILILDAETGRITDANPLHREGCVLLPAAKPGGPIRSETRVTPHRPAPDAAFEGGRFGFRVAGSAAHFG